MRKTSRTMRVLSAVASSAVLFQLPTCNFRDLIGVVGGINPCGTLLNCDPVAYTFGTSGYRGPGVDYEVDPACTFPPYCDDDPFIGGGNANP